MMAAGDKTVALDAHGEAHIRFSQEFDEKNSLLDATKDKTEKIVEGLQKAIVELYDWGKKTNTSQPNRYEALADAVMALGQRMPVDSKYGGSLMAINRAIRVSGGQQRRLQRAVEDDVMTPLRVWAKETYTEIVKERNILNRKRQDMEAATRRASKPQASEKDKQKLAETSKIYDRQWRTVKKLLDKLPEMHAQHRQVMVKILTLEKDYHGAVVQACDLSLQAVAQMDALND